MNTNSDFYYQPDEIKYFVRRVPAFFLMALSAIMLFLNVYVCPVALLNMVFGTVIVNIIFNSLPFIILFYLSNSKQIIKGITLGLGITWSFYFFSQNMAHACNQAEKISIFILCICNIAAYILALIYPKNDATISLKFIISLLITLAFIIAFSIIFSAKIAEFQEFEVSLARYMVESAEDLQHLKEPQNLDIFLVIRFTVLLLVSLYIYIKILNITNLSKMKIISAFLFSIIMSIPLSYTILLYELVFLVSLCLFAAIATKIRVNILITVVFIATAMCLGIDFFIQTIFMLILIIVETINLSINASQINAEVITDEHLASFSVTQHIPRSVNILLPLLILIFFAYLLFRTKRLRKGFGFLHDKDARRVGLVLSIIIMINMSFFSVLYDYMNEFGNFGISFFFFALINICTFGIYFWWTNHTAILYQQRVNERTIREFETEIDKLTKCNDFLAKTVHRDNKLIPAMFNAVNNYPEDVEARANILSELEEIMHERKTSITNFQNENQPLPATGIVRVDYLLNYMYQRACEKNIQLDLKMTADINDQAFRVITKQNLEILLADLIDNAILAVSGCEIKKILLVFRKRDNFFEIVVKDSGIPFSAETLAELGKKKTTTRTHEGGNGIGYVTIFNILDECNASLIISAKEDNGYTKVITVRFNGKNEFISMGN